MSYQELLVETNKKEYQLRKNLALSNRLLPIRINQNCDVLCVEDYRGCFSKSLAHDQTGKPDKKQIKLLLKGVFGHTEAFGLIKYPGAMRLINPSCCQSLNLEGPFKSCTKIRDTPLLSSSEAAADMGELYAMSLARDIPFTNYDQDETIAFLVQELNKFTFFGSLTNANIFRGTTKGDLAGPYLSQFLYLPYKHGIASFEQKYACAAENVDFLQSQELLLSVQNGITKEVAPARGKARYMQTLRDLCTYVHLDDSLQAGLNAALILNTLKCPSVKPKSKINENLFVDLGGLDLYELICTAVRSCMLCAWYHKWSILKIRPEAFGLEIDRKLGQGEGIVINEELLSSKILEKVFQKQGNYLLSQAYPEGAPCHPSMPSGHASYMGATVTILKAWYDEEFELDAFVPNKDGSKLDPLGYKLRVGDELNKLAANISSGRNAAGIHYRSDMCGLELGEAVALKILQAAVQRYTYQVEFVLHKFDGQKVSIKNF